MIESAGGSGVVIFRAYGLSEVCGVGEAPCDFFDGGLVGQPAASGTDGRGPRRQGRAEPVRTSRGAGRGHGEPLQIAENRVIVETSPYNRL